MILDLPAPPIPSFLKGLNIVQNDSENSEKCNHCAQFADQAIDGLSFTLPKQAQTNPLLNNNSLVISIALLIVSVCCLIALYIKYKKMKISMIDTCASFSQNFFFKNKDLEVSSRVDNCAPVVNEKTPQSIITNSPSKKSTIIPAKYWKTPTGNGINVNFTHPNNLMVNEFNGALIDGTMTTEMSAYLPEEGSCTSSPVYAELESGNHQINLDNMSNLITLNNLNNLNPMNSSQTVRYKSYTMRNYSDLPAMKISQLNQLNQLSQLNQLNQINSDTALLPDTSYDNEAYLPSSNSDYHNKSLKRNRQLTLGGKLGSKTPLLSTHCPTNVNHSLTLGYLNNDKPKQTFIQHQLGGRINVNNTLMLKNQDQDQIGIQPRYVQGNKKSILIYNGQPIISNSANFAQKRPLPKLPNNFI